MTDHPPTPPASGSTDRMLVVGVVVVAATMLGVAFYGSFHAISELADGRVTPPWLPPIVIDAGLVAFILMDLHATRARQSSPLLTWAVRGFSALTIVANAAAGWPSAVGVLLHIPAALTIVIITESARRHLLRQHSREDGREFDPIPFARWILSPIPTFLLWRRMVLWNERDYERAIDVDIDRRDWIDQCRALGRGWKRQVPANVRRQLRQGVRLESVGPRVQAIVGAARVDPVDTQENGLESSTPEQDSSGQRLADRPALPVGRSRSGWITLDGRTPLPIVARPELDPGPNGGGPRGGRSETPSSLPLPRQRSELASAREDWTPVMATVADRLHEPIEPQTKRHQMRALLFRHVGDTRAVAAELRSRTGQSKTPGDLYKYRAEWCRDVTRTLLELHGDADTVLSVIEDAGMEVRPEVLSMIEEWQAERANVRPLRPAGDS